ENDYKNMFPRFQEENLKHNLQKVEWLKEFAMEKGASTTQIALAWLLNQGDDIIPIVGMTKSERIHENLASLQIIFTKEEIESLNETFKLDALKGERYPSAFLAWAAS